MRTHVLVATDSALQAWLASLQIPELPIERIVRNKEASDKALPVLVCNSAQAERGRAHNWKITGSLELKTDISGADGQVSTEAKAASDALELVLLDAMENITPTDDRPQLLGDAITAAAIAAGAVASNEFMMVDCYIQRISAGFAEDTLWTFSVDFAATVVA